MQRKDRPSEALNKPQVSENEYEHFLLTLTEWSYLYRIGHYEVRSPETDQRCLPPLWAVRFSHRGEREMRVTGDETQGTMGRRDTSNPFFPSRLPSRASFHRERERRLGTRQDRCSVELHCWTRLCIRDLWPSFLRNHAIANKTSIKFPWSSFEPLESRSKEVRERSYLIC